MEERVMPVSGNLSYWTVLLLLGLAGFSRAQEPSGEEILKKVDRALACPNGLTETAQLEIRVAGQDPRIMKFKVAMKGEQLIRVDFLAPGNVKDMRFLTLSPRQMYAYVPAQRKVRRLGSHVLAMGFMGSAFSHEEMSLLNFSSLYTAKLVSQDKTTWTLRATARPDSDAPYPHLDMVIRQDNAIPQEIHYFNEKGIKIKVERRSDFECRGSKCLAKHLIMTDQVDPGKVSIIQILDWQFDKNLKDSFFTVASLRRAH